jgi:hypothetical protein
MADKLYRVSWSPGMLLLHAKDEARAIELALEYLRAPGAKRVTVKEVIVAEPGEVADVDSRTSC